MSSLAIVAAFKEEVKDYIKADNFRVVEREDYLTFYLSAQVRDVVIVEGGFGKERSIHATMRVIDKYAPETIVSAGFAGGAKSGMQTGEVFLCDELVSLEGSAALWKWGVEQHQTLDASVYGLLESIQADLGGVQVGKCITLPRLISSSEMKKWIGSEFSVNLIDMESYWVSQQAQARGIPCFIVRSVFDPMGQSLPKFISETLENPDGGTVMPAIKYALGNPFKIPELIRLGQQSRIARKALASLLLQLSPSQENALDFAVDVR